MGPLHIAILGHGAIADFVIKNINPVAEIQVSSLVCREASVKKAKDFAQDRFPVFTSLDQMKVLPGLLVDCSTHLGFLQHVPNALEIGIPVISISTGVLAQADMMEKLDRAAQKGKSSIKFLSGAVGGIDALASAATGEISQAVYTGRKPPAGWKGTPAENHCDLDALREPFTHFKGTAREAARLYPKNANVAATIALAGIGLDELQVTLIADPSVQKNLHEIRACGSFGNLLVQLEASPLAENPRSSVLAAMSIVAELKRRVSTVIV